MVKPSFLTIPFRVSVVSEGYSPSEEGKPPTVYGSTLVLL